MGSLLFLIRIKFCKTKIPSNLEDLKGDLMEKLKKKRKKRNQRMRNRNKCLNKRIRQSKNIKISRNSLLLNHLQIIQSIIAQRLLNILMLLSMSCSKKFNKKRRIIIESQERMKIALFVCVSYMRT